MRCRAPGPALARPPAADDVTVPSQDGARGDDQPHRGETVDQQRPGQQGKQRPVRPRQTRMSARPLALSHSELMAQHKDLGVLPPPLPPRQAQQRHRTGDNQEDQLQAHKPKIIPRPGRPRPDSHVPDAGPSDQRPAEHLARWHGFSAPTGFRALAPEAVPTGMAAGLAFEGYGPQGCCGTPSEPPSAERQRL